MTTRLSKYYEAKQVMARKLYRKYFHPYFREIQMFLIVLRQYTGIFFALAFLIFSVGYFYTQINSDTSFTGSFLVGVLFLSAFTDGFMMIVGIFRKPVSYDELSFDKTKVTIIIACYNGEKVIGETITQALAHVPKEQIIVVSDCSKDNTEKVASTYGVQVVRNERNVNKALSISLAVKHVKTEYVLILDDDTHIAKTFIPTNLIDQGYSAVAFNVMPEETGTLVNKLQVFEYRKSMILGKSLRASVGAISNISGAIGLFKTRDLIYQVTRHSGQFGGEDQQRTMLVHLEGGGGKGVAYVEATVYTEAPATIWALFKQRAKSWNCSVHETLVLCIRIIFSTKTHFMLKLERSYELFVFMTDPLRIIYFGTAFIHPINFVLLYILYLVVEILGWLKTGRKDPLYVVLISPIYSVFIKTPARFIASFWWFYIKQDYLRKRLHRYITDRKLLYEYTLTTLTVIFLWGAAITQSYDDISRQAMNALDYSKSNIVSANYSRDLYNLADDELLYQQTRDNQRNLLLSLKFPL